MYNRVRFLALPVYNSNEAEESGFCAARRVSYLVLAQFSEKNREYQSRRQQLTIKAGRDFFTKSVFSTTFLSPCRSPTNFQHSQGWGISQKTWTDKERISLVNIKCMLEKLWCKKLFIVITTIYSSMLMWGSSGVVSRDTSWQWRGFEIKVWLSWWFWKTCPSLYLWCVVVSYMPCSSIVSET